MPYFVTQLRFFSIAAAPLCLTRQKARADTAGRDFKAGYAPIPAQHQPAPEIALPVKQSSCGQNRKSHYPVKYFLVAERLFFRDNFAVPIEIIAILEIAKQGVCHEKVIYRPSTAVRSTSIFTGQFAAHVAAAGTT
ncbi:MAG: hypothetical protein Q8935_09130 [Bacillota bacterium]|nr:hypothetical protein [Bacillota bacterium]